MILSVFNCDKASGCFFVEAHKLSHVQQIITGITGVLRKGIEMIPYKDMTHLIQSCSTLSETNVELYQWVRVKSGLYEGDLGLVEFIDGGA